MIKSDGMSLLDYLLLNLTITSDLTDYQLGFFNLFANRRPWSYFLTLTFRDGFQDVSAKTVSSKLSSWAREVQVNRERFEYVVFEERGSPDSPPHLHGLLYLEPSYELASKLRTSARFGGPDTLDRLIESSWAGGLA